ncbi:hypothetical protein [Streptomyces sp. SID3343]|uniref:hypothetical protein n=1 Tax=Streptomyces sp. SID3343 TaxID=2690260 RepID=UPI0013687C04|nr:hypothetical protein [Streptomyces sp. SID3343]MYW01411.1 hypothetical protein [Streptomyces sp. SID3343]
MSLPDEPRPTLSDHDVRVLLEAGCADCATGEDPSVEPVVDHAWRRFGDALSALTCDPYGHGLASESAANPLPPTESAAVAAIARRVGARDLRVRAVRYREAVTRAVPIRVSSTWTARVTASR